MEALNLAVRNLIDQQKQRKRYRVIQVQTIRYAVQTHKRLHTISIRSDRSKEEAMRMMPMKHAMKHDKNQTQEHRNCIGLLTKEGTEKVIRYTNIARSMQTCWSTPPHHQPGR